MEPTLVLFVRHAEFDGLGRVLVGRSPGVHLNARGRTQVRTLVRRLAGTRAEAVYSSPLDRTRETAGPIARRLNTPLVTDPALLEVDYGDWTGVAVDDLRRKPRWRRFHADRAGTRIPGGELLLEVQGRVADFLARVRPRHPGRTVIAVTHADVIRCAVAHLVGIPLDHLERFEIAPVSATAVRLSDHGPRLLYLNSGSGP